MIELRHEALPILKITDGSLMERVCVVDTDHLSSACRSISLQEREYSTKHYSFKLDHFKNEE